jgi:subtilisin family serine protease
MIKFLTATAAVALLSNPAYADEYTYSPQLKQIGLDQAIQAYANYGKGITIAVVDTGVNPNHVELAGRVSTQSTCVATGNCGSGYLDTNFHGTFVSSIAAGALNNTGMVGVAPQSTILAVKIAQPNGSAYLSDMTTGLVTAANRGAQVINLSYTSFLTPTDTPSYATYNQSLVTALNATAAKGATTAIAGGNSSKIFMNNLNQGGFTSAALSRVLFVGSVNSSNTLSSFSNTPGTSKFTTTDGKTVALSSLWLMAPGENLIGAYYGVNNYYVQASGTSFSAPQVSGALALLESRWPVLYKNGTAAKVLLDTATDLGAKGVDSVYGAGLMNLNSALLPVGSLTIPNAKGTGVNVTSITGSLISSGAFGSLSTIKTKLASMSAFDSFSRDFTVNLSTLIATKPTAATVALPHGVQVVGSAYKFADGGSLSYAQNVSTIPTSFQNDPLEDGPKEFYLSMTDVQGTTMAGGYGFSATPSFTEALWGSNETAANGASSLGFSNALLSLTQGGAFMAYGEQLDSKTRYALSWSQTAERSSTVYDTSMDAPSASAMGLGLTHQMGENWSAGLTVNYLNETNQFLGATYANSALGFGDNHKSLSLGASAAINLDVDRSIVFDTAVARGNGANVQNSLIDSVSDVYAESIGVTYAEQNAFRKDDRFTISLKQPMRVFSGSANMTSSSVDADGNPVTSSDKIGLSPDGFETDLAIGYTAVSGEDKNTTWSANLTARHDADNIQGNQALDFMVSSKIRF